MSETDDQEIFELEPKYKALIQKWVRDYRISQEQESNNDSD